MPIVTITVAKPKPREFKAFILSAVHEALCSVGVNPRDRFHRVIELDKDDFHFDPHFPDVTTERTSDFVLVEILLGVGRSVKLKKAVLAHLTASLAKSGFDTENLMVVFQDVAWENWSPAGGRVPHS
jgi:phenylpyruvate tautomerase PptA (4-oxalocrotonate tautomerase family)